MSYSAPWGPLLKWATAFSCLVLGAVAVIGIVAAPADAGPAARALWYGAMVIVPACVLFGSAWFTVTGYTLVPGAILVRRLGWTTRVDLADLEAVTADPQAMRGSLRTFGNGGLFSFSGWFWNRRLGSYRAWATDPARAVVVRAGGRTFVVTPADPSSFAAALRSCSARR